MTQAQSAPADETSSTNLPVTVSRKIQDEGPWPTLAWLHQQRASKPHAVEFRGYIEIIRTSIVRDLLAGGAGMNAVPRMTPEFLSDFDKFNLTAQEGYMTSLIDGRTSFEKLLKLSPFDPFTTLFNLARLSYQEAIEIPE